jgi:hypothetical protein
MNKLIVIGIVFIVVEIIVLKIKRDYEHDFALEKIKEVNDRILELRKQNCTQLEAKAIVEKEFGIVPYKP